MSIYSAQIPFFAAEGNCCTLPQVSMKKNTRTIGILYPYIVTITIILTALMIGFALTYSGIHFWDDLARYKHSVSVLKNFGLIEGDGRVWMYAPLWELILGINTHIIFPFLRDPYWVRHAYTFALYLMTLYWTFCLLRRAGVSKATALLGVASIMGIIRLGGHALFNTKDVPGAVGYLLVTLYLWVLVKESLQHGFTIRRLILLGCASIIPFLLRSPLLLHAVLLFSFLLGYAVFAKTKLSIWKRIVIVTIPLLAGLLLLYALYPPLWSMGIADGLQKSFDGFQSYKWKGTIRAFGIKYSPGTIPWWYAFSWIPVIVHPLTLLAVIAGLLLRLRKKVVIGYTTTIKLIRGHIEFSLQRWLWIVVVLTWAAIMILRPRLYDEERHLLFLFPPLMLLGVLGLDILKEKWKYIIASILIAGSLFSYTQWGRYSYIYKSPLIGTYQTHWKFMGDYWMTCPSHGIANLKGRVPFGLNVRVDGVTSQARIQRNRLRENALFGDPEFHYVLRGRWPKEKKFAVIAAATMRSSLWGRVQKHIKSGKATLLWEARVPPGEQVCVLALYE